jgi:hypothetical protein
MRRHSNSSRAASSGEFELKYLRNGAGADVLYLVYGLSEVFQIDLKVFYLPGDPVTFVEALEKDLVQKFSEVGRI